MNFKENEQDKLVIEELLKENKSLKRRLSLLELNLSRTKQVTNLQDRVTTIINDSLVKEQKFFQLILENMTNILLLLDYDGRFAYASNIFLETIEVQNFGFIQGKDYRDVLSSYISPITLKRIVIGVFNAIHKKTISSFEEQIDFNFKKTPKIYSINIISMNYDGYHAGTMMLFIDITDINNALRAAEQANQAKSNFLATMSHEIRTPLNAILGLVQILLQKNYLNDEFIDALNRINNSGENLLGIINDILDLSKIETGKMELNPIEYDLPTLINDAVQLNMVRIGERPINFLLVINENLPYKLIGDELRLKQILNNLLSNAIKYTKKGFVKMTVENLPVDDNDNELDLIITIEDTGQGIKPEDQKKLFTDYLRFNTDINKNTEGTGIGLKITKNLVELMNGSISVETTYGKGSRFIVLVKQKRVDCEPIGTQLAESLCNFNYNDKKLNNSKLFEYIPIPYGKVLVVDDMETNLFVAEGLLKLYQLQIEKAINGYEAIKKVGQGDHFDIIFMDHMMPVMDGIQATQLLRSQGYQGTIIALTANALTGNDTMFMENGFDGFIPKPINIKQLDHYLKIFIRDKYPEQNQKFQAQVLDMLPQNSEQLDPKLIKIFCNDTEIIIDTLIKSLENKDLKLYTTNTHALKSMLASIGENKYLSLAVQMEKAGLDNNFTFIKDNHDLLISALTQIIKKLKPTINDITDDSNIIEDRALLYHQLEMVIQACEVFDDQAVFEALDYLQDKPWKEETIKIIGNIKDKIFLHSDFEEVVTIAKDILK